MGTLITACSGARDFDCALLMNAFASLIRALRVCTQTPGVAESPKSFFSCVFFGGTNRNRYNKSAVFNYTIRRRAHLQQGNQSHQSLLLLFYVLRWFSPISVFIALAFLIVAFFESGFLVVLFKRSSHANFSVKCPGTDTGASQRARAQIFLPLCGDLFPFLATLLACVHLAFAHKRHGKRDISQSSLKCSLLHEKKFCGAGYGHL